jgi:hypothetical protein
LLFAPLHINLYKACILFGNGVGCAGHRVHTEWQTPLSGVHSIIMEKSAQPGESGGCTPTHFHYVSVTNKVVVHTPARGQIHSMRPKARVLDQHGGPPAWLAESDPEAGFCTWWVGRTTYLFLTVPVALELPSCELMEFPAAVI